MMKRVREFKCNKPSDLFCYICGKYTLVGERRPINAIVKNLYKLYFGMEIEHQEMCWVPHNICTLCRSNLTKWTKNEGHLSFGKPMIWRDPIDHQNNCYICLTHVFGYSKKNRNEIQYATVNSVTLSVLHSAYLIKATYFSKKTGFPIMKIYMNLGIDYTSLILLDRICCHKATSMIYKGT